MWQKARTSVSERCGSSFCWTTSPIFFSVQSNNKSPCGHIFVLPETKRHLYLCLPGFLSTASLLASWWVCGPSITLCPFLSATPFSKISFSFPASLAPPFLTSASSPHTLSRSASHYFYPPECGPAPLHANRKPQLLFCLDSTQAQELLARIPIFWTNWHIERRTKREEARDNYFFESKNHKLEHINHLNPSFTI